MWTNCYNIITVSLIGIKQSRAAMNMLTNLLQEARFINSDNSSLWVYIKLMGGGGGCLLDYIPTQIC